MKIIEHLGREVGFYLVRGERGAWVVGYRDELDRIGDLAYSGPVPLWVTIATGDD